MLLLVVLSRQIEVVILYCFFQAEDGIRVRNVTGVQTCALPIFRSAAAQIRNSSDSLGKARALEERTGLSQSVTSRMMTTVPWSREGQVLATLADYQVRFEALFTTPLGRSASVMLTAKYGATELPATVGELVDALGNYAPASGSLPIGTFEGIGSMSITVV